MSDQQSARQANRLYWETDASVADIAEELDISRRMLYDLVEPRPAERPCPECGSPLVFRNRTALDRRHAECLVCEVEITLAAPADDDAAEGADHRRGVEPQVEQERAAGPLSPVASRYGPLSASGPLLGGALLLGLATGAAAAYLVRHR